jgi:DNA-binding XRE family transcriptional regulator
MREEMEHVLKQRLRVLALETRSRLGLTQKEMSELLSMGERSYFDIESGNYKCGTLTAFLLLVLQEDPNIFLDTVRDEFDRILEKEMQMT